MFQATGLSVALLWGAAALFAQPAPAPVSKIFDRDVRTIESELVPLVEAMPADKYGFAPAAGEFKGVRTFAQQVKHVAVTIYTVSAAVLGEKNPTDPGPDENGPASIKTKDQIVQYLKDSFTYAHKATASLTEKNMADMIKSPFGNTQVTIRLDSDLDGNVTRRINRTRDR